MRKLAGILALAMVMTMVSIPAFAAVETDPVKVSMAENFVAFEEDFSDNSNGWLLEGPAQIRDGKLYLSTPQNTAEDGVGTAKLAISPYTTSGNWYITMKVQATNGSGTSRTDNTWFSQIAAGTNQSGRLYWNVRRGGVVVPSEDQTPDAAKAASNGGFASSFSDRMIPEYDPSLIYEYLFAHRTISLYDEAKGEYKDYNCYDIYRRPVEEDGTPLNNQWEKVNNQREAYWQTGTLSPANNTFHFSSAATNYGSLTTVDDLRIYQGAYAGLSDPVIENGSMTVGGSYMYGYEGIENDRRFTHLSVVYDKKYGYTKQVVSNEHTATGGRWESFSQNVYGLDETTDTVATLLWDDVDSGIPLLGAKDTANRNTADEVYEEIPSPLTFAPNFNEVVISGNLGEGIHQLTASLTEKSTGNLAAVVQTTNNSVGKIKTVLGLDPVQWSSGTYILRIQTGSSAAESHEVELYTGDVLGGGVHNANDMKNFLANYASDEIKARANEEGFADAVFAEYQELAGANAGATDLYAFREYLDPAIETTVEKLACLNAINQELGAEIVIWGNVRILITDTYADTLGITEADKVKLNSVVDQKTLYTALQAPYTNIGDVKVDLFEEVGRLLAIQNAASSGGNTGGFGGGGFGGGGGSVIGGGGNSVKGTAVGGGAGAGAITPPATVEEKKSTQFTDLGSVSWAATSINALQTMGVVNGDGDGNFHPNRSVTREEFLKMAMQAAGIKVSGGNVAFGDVDPGAWYYDYVAAAYQAGIINGIDENTFGIGQEITRADMAVILKRIMDYVKVEIVPNKNAFVFDDFDSIPKYARESITTLCQGGLMNGVGDNRFDAGASATRAESAVAIHRIYNYIEGR